MMADKMIPSGKRGKTYFRLRTLDDMANCITWAKENSTRQSVEGTHDFTGTKSIADYESMLREGWAAGVKDVEGLDGLSSDQAERLNFTRSPGGAFPIVPAFLSGAPDAMLRPVTVPVDHVRSLTLIIDAAFNCGIRASRHNGKKWSSLKQGIIILMLILFMID